MVTIVPFTPLNPLPSFPDFPASPEEVTAQWLTSVLQGHGHDVTVEAITMTRIGTGQIGQNIRFALSYRGLHPADAPTSLVGKFVSPDATSRATGLALGIYAKEAIFYRDFAPRLAGSMRVATCWAAEFDASREATVLLMEDLAPAEQGDQMRGCSLEEAETAVVELAALHRTFWANESIRSTEGFSDPKDPIRIAFLQQLLALYWPAFIERYRDRLRTDQIDVGNSLVDSVEGWILERSSPLTLVHGDYRADNLMLAPGISIAVDWQTVGVGYGGIDLGYFLGASLPADTRRANEDRLIDLWREHLGSSIAADYSQEQAWADYRHGQFAGFITAVVSSMITERTERGDEMFWTMADRHLTTAIDTDAVSLLPPPPNEPAV